MYKVVISYKKGDRKFDEYLIANENNLQESDVLTLLKDINNTFYIISMENVDSLSIIDTSQNGYICNYGGLHSTVVYATSEDEALNKYVNSIKRIYSGVKLDECNCELYSNLGILI